jgi:integrase
MRRGEVLGLRWRDVDLAASRLSVHQALVSVKYEVQLSDVKTGAGWRAIDLTNPSSRCCGHGSASRARNAFGSALPMR